MYFNTLHHSLVVNRDISTLGCMMLTASLQLSFNWGVAPGQTKRACVQDVWLLTLIHQMPFLLSVCVSHKPLVFIKTATKKKKCPEQPSPLHLHIGESCCDKLSRWLNTAIRQHTVCLTKCFLPDTLELSWLLAAWFWVFIWAPLWGSVSISGSFVFCHHGDPATEDTWCGAADGAAAAGLHTQPDGAMLDLSGGPLPCPPSIRQRPFCVTFWHICWHVSFGNRC